MEHGTKLQLQLWQGPLKNNNCMGIQAMGSYEQANEQQLLVIWEVLGESSKGMGMNNSCKYGRS